MKIDHASPAAPNGAKDAAFTDALAAYRKELADFGTSLQRDLAAGKPLQSFPPVRTAQWESIPGSDSVTGNLLGAGKPGPNLGKLNQHLMSNVLGPMEKNIQSDEFALKQFLQHCK